MTLTRLVVTLTFYLKNLFDNSWTFFKLGAKYVKNAPGWALSGVHKLCITQSNLSGWVENVYTRSAIQNSLFTSTKISGNRNKKVLAAQTTQNLIQQRDKCTFLLPCKFQFFKSLGHQTFFTTWNVNCVCVSLLFLSPFLSLQFGIFSSLPLLCNDVCDKVVMTPFSSFIAQKFKIFSMHSHFKGIK